MIGRMSLVAMTLGLASPASAIISVDAHYVMRSGTIDVQGDSQQAAGEQELGGNDLRAGLHLDPIPLVPVSFGVSINMPNLELDSKQTTVKDLKGLVITPEVRAWLPIPGLPLVPFARLGYSLGGYEATINHGIDGIEPYKAAYTSNGLTMGAGVKWAPLPLPLLRLNIIAGVNFMTTEWDDKTDDIPNVPSGLPLPKGFDGGKGKATTFTLGVEVGI